MYSPPKSWKELQNHYKVVLDNPWYQRIAIIQSEFIFSTFSFFRKKNIHSVALPVTTGSITSPMGKGSDSLPVKISLEGIDTYLADSMQFHLEYLLRVLPNGVHYLMPTFRGEKADQRHLCQFYHSEAEIQGTLDDVINLVSEYVHYLCVDLLQKIPDAILDLAGTTKHIEKVIKKQSKYEKISWQEAIQFLKRDDRFIQTHQEGFKTITNLGEQELVKHFDIVWLTHHDYLSVPFYQAIDEEGKYAKNGDLLFGIGEIVGAGERHATGDEVRKSIVLHDVDEAEYEWYIQMKDQFPMKTSGFGMGMERFILWLIQHNDIRDIQIIPRFNGINSYP